MLSFHRLYSSIEEEKKVRKATGEPRRERKAGPSAGFVYIDDSEGDEEEEEVEEAPVDVDVEDPDITGDLPILDAAGEVRFSTVSAMFGRFPFSAVLSQPLPKVRKIHGLYESMLRFGLGRWAEIQTAANLQQYPIPVIVAYVRAILSLCSSGLPDAIQANMTLVSFEPLLVSESVASLLPSALAHAIAVRC